MFANRRIRIVLLTVAMFVAVLLFYARGFAGFASDWPWVRSYTLEAPELDMSKLRLSSFERGVVITGVSDAIGKKLINLDRVTGERNYQKFMQADLLADHAPPLLDLQISPDREALRAALESKTGQERGNYLDFAETVAPLTHIVIEQDGDLRISARFFGTVADQQCATNGACLIAFDASLSGKNAVFYSQDGGANWRWLSQWKAPEKSGSFQLVGITGEQTILLAQNRTLYQSHDFGQHWRKVFELDQVLTKHGGFPDGNPILWKYDGRNRMIILKRAWSDEVVSPLAESSLLIDFDLATETARPQWVDGTICSGEFSPQGDFYFILASKPRVRYSMNKLHRDGTVEALLETGKKTLDNLYVGNRLLMMEKEFNDPMHMTVSTDGGQHWSRMKKLPDNYGDEVLFDRWHDRLFRFYIPEFAGRNAAGNRFGLTYETASMQP